MKIWKPYLLMLKNTEMKSRKIRTLVEKFGVSSVLEDAKNVLDKRPRWENEFNELPYLGICYVDWDDRKASNELIYYFEDFTIENTSLIKLKVLDVNDETFTIAHYDDHHHDICIIKAKTREYKIEGNIIKSA